MKESSKEEDIFASNLLFNVTNSSQNDDIIERKLIAGNDQKLKYLDPFCYYNTSLQSLYKFPGVSQSACLFLLYTRVIVKMNRNIVP